MESLPFRLDDHPAWQQAWRLRCCPPDRLLVKPPDNRLREHLEICPWCRAAMELPLCPIPEEDACCPAETPLGSGQLYALDLQLAGWGPKARYYNPPVVLVLSLTDAHSVFVCQTYGDPDLAGPDDIALGGGFAGFAQPWNCYTLMRQDLGLHLGTVDALVAEMVRRQIDQGRFSPLPGSLLWFFRQMEVETGFFFSSRSVDQLLARHERASIPFPAGIDNGTIRRDLHSLPVRFPLVDLSAASVVDLLFWAEPDPKHLPLAAADTEIVPALVFTLEYGRLTAAEVVPLSVSFCEYADNLLTVTGSIASLPSGSRAWLFRWHTGGQLIEPLPEHAGHDNLLFWAAFPLTPEQATQPGHLVVRILREEGGGSD